MSGWIIFALVLGGAIVGGIIGFAIGRFTAPDNTGRGMVL